MRSVGYSLKLKGSVKKPWTWVRRVVSENSLNINMKQF